ncbi:hypothetical protein GEV33_004073 [Tenebrio molitor]|uniref:Tyr recombinase domain-containing protein n=1 Tax=Tenebrio molitor TaxID=7067 RepID=A0A8J6HSA8_TENMO|nr:hypothetical protein GEV33_004073 [Tenebrio molitor]
MTASMRREEDFLFLTTTKPHSAASKQTISRWVKDTLQMAGVDVAQFKPHSTRHASTSSWNLHGPDQTVRRMESQLRNICVVFRALRTGVALDGLVALVTAPCAVWDANFFFTEEDHHGQRESVITPFHTILSSLNTGESGLPPNRLSSMYDLLHLVATTSHPYMTRPVNGPAVS